jgi:hypothetical protein
MFTAWSESHQPIMLNLDHVLSMAPSASPLSRLFRRHVDDLRTEFLINLAQASL